MERELMPDYGAEQFYQFLIPKHVFQPAGFRQESASQHSFQQVAVPGQGDLQLPAHPDRQTVIAHQPSF